MQKINLKGAVPHLIALAAFLLITIIYFQPLFQGQKIYQGDIVNYKGMSQEIIEHRNETGEEALWTNRMFGGMPAYQISHKTPSNLIMYADKFIGFNFPREASFVLIAFIGFYILLLSMGLSVPLAVVGAIGFGLSSYIFIILEAGHNTKAHAIAYMAPVLAGIIMAFRGKVLKGAALTALFLALQLRANHLQITYYLLFMVLIFGVFELVHAIRYNKLPSFIKTGCILIFAALLAVCSNIEKIWTTYEYGKASTRSQSELTIDGDQENKTSGLNKDYATSWSYGKIETFNLMIPNFMGGASGSELSQDSETYKVLKANRVPNAKKVIKRMPTYWGTQPFTSGPVYIGAIMCFLFVSGLFLVKGRVKWWLLSCTILSFALAWGNNMMWLTDLFLDYVPGYNKFRTVSMILVIAELTIPLLGLLALKEFINDNVDRVEKIKSLKFGLGIVGGVSLMFALVGPSMFSFSGMADAQYPEFLVSALEIDRAGMLQSDAFRSFMLIILSALVIYLFLIKKITPTILAILIAALVLVDMLPVNNRYLDKDDFVKARKMEQPFQMTNADKQILNDKELNFRVFNPTERLDAGARTSYFHNNIAGYHGAKLKRYQELMDMQIAKNNQSVINMLNVKYIFQKSQSGELIATINPSRIGAAWFIENLQQVENADEEMGSISNFAPRQEAFIDKRFGKKSGSYITSGSIVLTNYKPNHLVYNVNAPDDKVFAVFSEIYYEKGWNAYIDGELQEHFRVNYVLRGMELPRGQYELAFKFEPKSVSFGSSIALVSSLLIYLLLFYIGFNAFRSRSS